MSNCKIDAAGAKQFANDLRDGAERFCKEHTEEGWTISGVSGANSFTLSASDGTRRFTGQLLPSIDMAQLIFETLQEWASN